MRVQWRSILNLTLANKRMKTISCIFKWEQHKWEPLVYGHLKHIFVRLHTHMQNSKRLVVIMVQGRNSLSKWLLNETTLWSWMSVVALPAMYQDRIYLCHQVDKLMHLLGSHKQSAQFANVSVRTTQNHTPHCYDTNLTSLLQCDAGVILKTSSQGRVAFRSSKSSYF